MELNDQIVRVDASALLRNIKEIEHQLSEYHRQDKIPPWADAIIKRLERLEASDVASKAKLSKDLRDNAGPVTIQDLANDERIISKVKDVIDTDLSGVKLGLESKVTSLSMEVERLHKLLQIRPTNSDLQQLTVGIQQLDMKINETMSDAKNAFKNVIQQQIVNELESIHKDIISKSLLSNDSIISISKRVDTFQQDIKDIRSGIESFMSGTNKSIDTAQELVNSCKNDISALQGVIEENNHNTQQAFSEVKFAQQMANDIFSDYKASVTGRLMKMDESVSNQDILLKDTVMQVESSLNKTEDHFAKLETTLDDFKKLYVSEQQTNETKLTECASNIADVHARLSDTESFINLIKTDNVLETVKQQSSVLQSHETKLSEHFISISKLFSSSEELHSHIVSTNSNLEGTKLMVSDILQRLNKIDEDMKLQDASIASLQGAVQKADTDLSRLFVICDEIAMHREQIGGIDQRLKSHQSTLSTLLENSDDHDRRIEQIVELMEKADENLVKKMDMIRSSIMDLLMQRQAEMDASLQNMKDNIDILSSAGEGSIGGGRGRMGTLASKKGPLGGPGSLAGGIGSGNSISGEHSQLSQLSHSISPATLSFLADLCMNFEEIAIKKTFVPELPPAMREHLTTTCQEQAEWMSTLIDSDVVQRLLQETGEEGVDADKMIHDKRTEKVDELIQAVRESAHTHHPNPGIVRYDAREKFLKQLRKAMDLCLSKHNQVRLGIL